MKVHFREQYGTRGDEVLYVVPVGKIISHYNTEISIHFGCYV